MATNSGAVASNMETLITTKVIFDGNTRKFKLPLQEMGASVFAEKIRSLLQIQNSQLFVLERFSDSGNAYITLDQNNPSAYKQLYRAAKAKGKLRIRATLVDENMSPTNSVPQKREHGKTEPIPRQMTGCTFSHPHSVTSTGRPAEIQGAVGARDYGCLAARDQFFQQLANLSREREMGIRMQEPPAHPQVPSNFWQIFCNNCDKPMSDAHFHCSICDGGDYDLCESCVESGKICPGEGHWLIKRFIKSGNIVTSATETVAPKFQDVLKVQREMPAALEADVKVDLSAGEPNRTCNACVRVLPESALVTCTDCPDYDLCVPCLKIEEGHHPGHGFAPIDPSASLARDTAKLCVPGRNTRHYALCDGCDEPIYGVRHKCLNCPDWDYCNKCFEKVGTAHPGHRFVPVYTNMEVVPATQTIHFGILCDGPLCTNKPGKAYIQGTRYKCAVCDDTDFCANCEAHPSFTHNETHPLIKFKTPVRGAHVTVIDDAPGRQRQIYGDSARRSPRPVARAPSMQPVVALPPPYTALAERPKPVVKLAAQASSVSSADLDAHYVKDRVADGTTMSANKKFVQSWTLKNPGPRPWPVGTAVYFVGGDKMSLGERSDLTASKATTKTTDAGQEYDFEVPMQAPLRPGKHISYFRLKAPDGLPFGHKLWCDIEVASSATASGSPSVVSDYERKLRELEQQNQERLLQAQRETAAASTESRPATPVVEKNPLTGSIMVFPTLDKESPASSILREAPAAATASFYSVPASETGSVKSEASPETDVETATSTVSVPEADERFEDLESVEYQESDEEEDGFLTDEEYDILDASDEEVSNRGRSTM